MNHTPEANAGQSNLSAAHRAELAASGITPEAAAANGIHTETDMKCVGRLLNWTGGRAFGDCLAFHYFAADGTPTGYVRVKPTKPRTSKRKEDKGKVIKYEAPKGCPNRAYFPVNTRPAVADPTAVLLLTEGEKKAVSADAHGFPCIGLSGVWSWQAKRAEDETGAKVGERELIPDLAAVAWAGRTAVLAFDSDAAANDKVRFAQTELARVLGGHGATVRVVRLPPAADGRKQGVDDFLVAHGADAFACLVSQAGAADGDTDPRPEITIDTDEYRVNDEAAAALALEPDLFQRGGLLVYLQQQGEDSAPAAAIRRRAGSPVVLPLVKPLLRERLSRCARWQSVRVSDEGEVYFKAEHPPGWCVEAVHARGHWPHVRHLEAVVNHPVLLPDGSLLTRTGYHPASGILAAIPPDLAVSVPDRPTPAEVTAAVAALLDPIRDFPFETDAHRAAWVAGLLTPLAWFAFDGPAPLFLIDANVRAAGKGLLADVAALALTGRRFSVMTYTHDTEEMEKRITTLALEGERLVLLDNLAGAVGNDKLDAALTATEWQGRVLGVSKTYKGPLQVVWFGTGNNVALRADTSRRVCHVRMESAEERPELRTDVTYPDLRAHVLAHRGQLLSAALTVLRGWVAAGKPKHNLPAWGSYEQWSGVVREAVVFAGLPDPGDTRGQLQSASDRDAAAMLDLLAGWEKLDTGGGLTAAEVVAKLRDEKDAADWLLDLRAAVEELCGKLDGRALGNKLRHFKRRNFNGKMIDAPPGGKHANRWRVFPAGGCSDRTRPPDPPHPPSPPPPAGGEGGERGQVPPATEANSGKRRYRSNPHRGTPLDREGGGQ